MIYYSECIFALFSQKCALHKTVDNFAELWITLWINSVYFLKKPDFPRFFHPLLVDYEIVDKVDNLCRAAKNSPFGQNVNGFASHRGTCFSAVASAPPDLGLRQRQNALHPPFIPCFPQRFPQRRMPKNPVKSRVLALIHLSTAPTTNTTKYNIRKRWLFGGF